jgi:hypothetical protein
MPEEVVMSSSARPDPTPAPPAPELEELVVEDDTPPRGASSELPLEADLADVLDQRRDLDDLDDFDAAEVFDATD